MFSAIPDTDSRAIARIACVEVCTCIDHFRVAIFDIDVSSLVSLLIYGVLNVILILQHATAR